MPNISGSFMPIHDSSCVLGAEAPDRAAMPDDTRAMTTLLEGVIMGGAVEFGTNAMLSRTGHGGQPLAARMASRDEPTAYCGVLAKFGVDVIEVQLTKQFAHFADYEYEL